MMRGRGQLSRLQAMVEISCNGSHKGRATIPPSTLLVTGRSPNCHASPRTFASRNAAVRNDRPCMLVVTLIL